MTVESAELIGLRTKGSPCEPFFLRDEVALAGRRHHCISGFMFLKMLRR
jgi:hypothetical protein